MTCFKQKNETNIKLFLMVTGLMNYGQQTIQAVKYIGQNFMIILSHANRLPVTIQCPYEKLITSERFCGRKNRYTISIPLFMYQRSNKNTYTH